jgi:uncharacterized membrane protein YkvA (DUF1232 family)
MAADKKTSIRDLIPKQENPGFFQGLVAQLRLVLRLMGDPRVNILLKVLPVASLVYLIFPDLLFGPLDDAAVLGLGLYLFVELCPNEVVEEHRAALSGRAPKGSAEADEVVDSQFAEGEEDLGD